MYHGTKVLDVHGHISTPPEYFHFGALQLAGNGPTGKLNIPDERLEQAQQRHLKEIDSRSVDVQLIGPRPFASFQWARPHIQRAWARATNDVTAQIVRLHPDRFLGMAMLPQSSEEDTSAVLPEFDRCVNELGFVGAYLNPDPSARGNTPGLHESYWFPLYARAQELNVPLMVHPTATLDRRVEVLNANYQIANVLEEYIATQLLTRTDVFERFPELKVIVCHCGGSLDRWIKTDPHMGQKDLSRNLFFDTCAHDEAFLEAAFRQRGVDQMLFGTEVPGSGGAPRPDTGKPADDLVPVIDKIPFLSDEDKKKVFNTNPAKVFPQMAKI
jgi:predicted TIM-barrel fold metal-dependent hydrolase